MAELGNINLFPPIIDTYIPAFVREVSTTGTVSNKKYSIEFTFPEYNNYTEVLDKIQVSLVNQLTNQSVLDTNIWKLDIKFAKIERTKTIMSKYYIEIDANDLEEKEFQNNQFYKMQLRFISKEVPDFPEEPDATWLYNNRKYFSEWSKPCLLRFIDKPLFTFRNFDNIVTESNPNNPNMTDDIYLLGSQNLNLSGQMHFGINSSEKETLYKYKVYVKEFLSGDTISSSKTIYTDKMHPNEINHNFNYLFKSKEDEFSEVPIMYFLFIEYETNNGYKNIERFCFQVEDNNGPEFNVSFDTKPNRTNGQIDITIMTKKDSSENKSSVNIGDIIIKRSSSKTNFTTWEDIHIVNQDPYLSAINYQWSDATVESSIWYMYSVQNRTRDDKNRTIYSKIVYSKEPVTIMLNDMFLMSSYTQLNIQLNPQISSMQYRVSDSINETLGSKYPYVKRNGDMGYYKFTISGLISRCMDENELFTNEEDIYGEDNVLLYRKYNEENNIGYYNDYFYEREFRKRVIEFLNDGKPKLFRSTTEGNMIVRITEVSLTPETSLGRMIYSFTASATEIAEANISNYDKFNIQNIDIFYEYVLKIIDYDATQSMAKITPANINKDNNVLYLTKTPINRKGKEKLDAQQKLFE